MAIAQNVGARRHQSHCVTKRLKLPAPMMCGRTSLNADHAGGQTREKLQQLRTADPLADRHLAITIHAVEFEIQTSQYRDQTC